MPDAPVCSPTRNDPGKKRPEPNHLVFCIPVRTDNARSLHFRRCPHHRNGFACGSAGSQRICARNPDRVVYGTIRDTRVRVSDGSYFGNRVRSLQFSTDSPVSRLARVASQKPNLGNCFNDRHSDGYQFLELGLRFSCRRPACSRDRQANAD